MTDMIDNRFTVLFDNGEYNRVIGQVDTKDEAYKVVSDFLIEHNYKSYYTRVTNMEYGEWLDVGSHTQFFMIVDKPEFLDQLLDKN